MIISWMHEVHFEQIRPLCYIPLAPLSSLSFQPVFSGLIMLSSYVCVCVCVCVCVYMCICIYMCMYISFQLIVIILVLVSSFFFKRLIIEIFFNFWV
jgi:hypothetical protein